MAHYSIKKVKVNKVVKSTETLTHTNIYIDSIFDEGTAEVTK